jgi:hypothetical protein
LERAGKVITQLFERREREFLLSPVRVTMHSSLEDLEIGDVKLNAKEGETLELPRWVAEELALLNLGEIQEEAFETEIFKALTREKMMGPSQLSPLQPNFYLKMRRRLTEVKGGTETGRFRREDYERLKANCYDLIGRRLSKLLSVSSSANLETLGDKVTSEEKVFFSSTRSFSDEWKKSLLGE